MVAVEAGVNPVVVVETAIQEVVEVVVQEED